MALNIKLEAFEGPFDLLFHLIEKNQIDIYDIPIADLTDQYLSYLEHIGEEELDMASEFLVMAATLLSIKSKMLLPQPKDEEVQLELSSAIDEIDPREELISRLVEYKKFKEIAAILKVKEEDQRKIFKRPPEDMSHLWTEDFNLEKITLDDLMNSFLAVVNRKTPEKKVHQISRESLPLPIRIKEIYKLLKGFKTKVPFSNLYDDPATKSDIIVTFLAVLELVKMNKVLAAQERLFGEIVLAFREV